MTVEEWLGKENQLGTDIWTKKYCNDGENFDQWLDRISGGNREIAAYIRSGEPMDKAGAYGIQGLGRLFVESICGDYFNIVGLPVSRLMRALDQFS